MVYNFCYIVLLIELYYSLMLAFETYYVGDFLVFNVLIAKILVFSTFDTSAHTVVIHSSHNFFPGNN